MFEKIQGVETVKTAANGEPVYYTLPPSDTAIIFFLKTRAKNRGYVERQEITGKDGDNLFQSMTEQEKQDLVKRITNADK